MHLIRKRTTTLVIGLAVSVGVVIFLFGHGGGERSAGAEFDRDVGSVEGLEAAYRAWIVRASRTGEHRRLELALRWSKGLSSEFSRATGMAVLDLDAESLSVEVSGLEEKQDYEAWLVDNRPGEGRSVRPELGDVIVFAGRLTRDGSQGLLNADVGEFLAEHEADLLVVTRGGNHPSKSGLLFGSPSLFQRLYARGTTESPGDDARVSAVNTQQHDTILEALTVPRVYAAATVPAGMNELVELGEDLFFNETFNGNGRTCGTCHPAENNFTIDPAFIATLDRFNPLFVAEFTPALSENFENPKLMRSLGLIVENQDGFGDLATNFNMRSVSHTLALPTSLRPAPNGADGSTVPPNERTGWSGDGSPGSGTLREFAIGAVTQHFPLTLGRVDGVDFRLPTDEELDAMAAFQLSLGRQEDLDLTVLRLAGELPRRGQAIFLASDTEGGTVAAGKCDRCHANAGASLPGGDFNFNFNTGIEDLADQPADLIDPLKNPPDGGFGTDPHPTIPNSFGNGTFNTPPLVEAADTGPFFHNHSIQSLEEAVNFYNSEAFQNSPSGQFLRSQDSGAIGIQLEATQVEAVAAFLRVINVLENIRSALQLQRDFSGSGGEDGDQPRDPRPLVLSLEEIEDAIGVLQEASLHPEAVRLLEKARDLSEYVEFYASRPNGHSHNSFSYLNLARIKLEAARAELLDRGSEDGERRRPHPRFP